MDVRASALAVLSFVGLDSGPVEPLSFDVDDPPVVNASPFEVIPDAETPLVNLDAVWWTAPKHEPVGLLAERWGMKEAGLRALNPDFRGDEVEVGQRFVVYRQREGVVSRSVGAPNRGRLENGVPFVEGKYWHLRVYRPKSFATRDVVVNLATALERWGASHPDAAPVKIGEFSKRGGGKLKPHSSHRTGRDVDMGYVMNASSDGHKFGRVNENNMDAEATWGLVHSLLATGAIDYIFMNAYVQRMLLPYAKQDLAPDELARVFSVAAEGYAAQNRAVLKHWRGHDDHMHVRFACTPIDVNCREAKKRKKKRKR